MDLSQVVARTVQHTEENRFQKLMGAHHYLGALPKISNTIWYIATWNDEWIALTSFSAAALKCGARDHLARTAYYPQY